MISKSRYELQRWFDVGALEEGPREQNDMPLPLAGTGVLMSITHLKPKGGARDIVKGACLSEEPDDKEHVFQESQTIRLGSATSKENSQVLRSV